MKVLNLIITNTSISKLASYNYTGNFRIFYQNLQYTCPLQMTQILFLHRVRIFNYSQQWMLISVRFYRNKSITKGNEMYEEAQLYIPAEVSQKQIHWMMAFVCSHKSWDVGSSYDFDQITMTVGSEDVQLQQSRKKHPYYERKWVLSYVK
jgi:hypothetical protein